MSREDLLALTSEAVAALANLGLVKRAQREIQAGQGPSLDEDTTTGLVTGTFADGVVTKIPRGVPLPDTSCTCGATTVCRHRVAVVLAYPAWHEARGGTAATTAETWSPACFSDDDLSKLVGKRVFARAKEILRTGIVVELDAATTPLAKLPTCAVRFHVVRDLAYARCDCKVSIACEHVVLATWAFRRAEETHATLPCTLELGATVASGDDAPLAEANRLAEYVIAEGIANLGDADKARFARARATLASASHLLWPSMLVDDLEMALEAYRARSARYRTSDAVETIASLAARTRAASSAASELPRRFVLGSDEARETPLDHVRLVSLGVRLFADGQTRDAEVYLADPDTGVVLVASKRFRYDDDKPAENGPELARRAIAARITLGALAHGQLVTRAAKRHANHAVTLAVTRTAQTSLAPTSGDWSALPPSLLVTDVRALETAMRARPPRLLRPRTLASEIRVIAVSSVARVAYRTGEQELVAELHDATGGTVLLARRHASVAPHALDVLARALQGSVRFVAGDVRLGPHGVELDPTAIVTDRVLCPDVDVEKPCVADLPVTIARPVSAMHVAVENAQALLEEALHDGVARLRKDWPPRVTAAAEALAKVGLGGVEKRLRKLRDDPTADRWVDAAIRLDLTREAMVMGVESEASG